VRRRSCEEISRPSMHVHGRGSEPKMASFLHLWLENAVRPACALGECYYSTLKTGRSGARCWSPHPLRWHCAAAEGLRAGETTNGTIQEDSDGDLHALSLPNEISPWKEARNPNLTNGGVYRAQGLVQKETGILPIAPGRATLDTDDTQKKLVKSILDRLASKEGRIPTRRIENPHTKE